MSQEQQPAHGGAQAVAAARRHGVQTMFTLSGGHVFPLYDGAVKGDPPMRIVDVRHEQTAVFAAEATARLTRALADGRLVVTVSPAGQAVLASSARASYSNTVAAIAIAVAGAW